MHEKIAIKLASQIAQLNYDNMLLQVQVEELQKQVNQLTAELEEATKPNEEGEQYGTNS